MQYKAGDEVSILDNGNGVWLKGIVERTYGTTNPILDIRLKHTGILITRTTPSPNIKKDENSSPPPVAQKEKIIPKPNCWYWVKTACSVPYVVYIGVRGEVIRIGTTVSASKEDFEFLKEVTFEDSPCGQTSKDPPSPAAAARQKCPYCQNGYYTGLGLEPTKKCEKCNGKNYI